MASSSVPKRKPSKSKSEFSSGKLIGHQLHLFGKEESVVHEVPSVAHLFHNRRLACNVPVETLASHLGITATELNSLESGALVANKTWWASALAALISLDNALRGQSNGHSDTGNH
jgi:hypothetical protein